ncbi:uncharacterized protein DS421_18g604810 [Arachis hypogaea]|nr:uncharacterized protein DS421_18g604810 [Arachis hypogaea]
MGKKKLLESRCSPSYIHDMMSTLSKNNSVEKLAEIDEIGFGFLRLVPNWSVKQAIMVHLAESYQVKQRTFILDIGNIRLNAELIGKVFGLPSRVDPFPVLDDCNPCHVAIKKRFHRRTTTELRDLVYSCPMATESDRMEFRRYFLLVVMKMFLCPTTQQVLSPWHIYPVLDVSDPRRFNWPLETLKWFDKAVEKYKLKGNKMCEGCMFVMLILYFQRLQYSLLDNCLEHEPWLDAWASERLEKKAQGEGEDIKGQSPQAARRKPGKKAPQKRGQKDSVPPRGSSVGGESRQVSKERQPSGRTTAPHPTRRSSRRAEGSKTSPRCRFTEGNLNQDNVPNETPVSRVPDAGALSVANPNFLSNRDPESERIWQYFEQLQNTRPLQTVMSATPSCMTPSPPSKKISPGMTRTEQQSTQCTPMSSFRPFSSGCTFIGVHWVDCCSVRVMPGEIFLLGGLGVMQDGVAGITVCSGLVFCSCSKYYHIRSLSGSRFDRKLGLLQETQPMLEKRQLYTDTIPNSLTSKIDHKMK